MGWWERQNVSSRPWVNTKNVTVKVDTAKNVRYDQILSTSNLDPGYCEKSPKIALRAVCPDAI